MKDLCLICGENLEIDKIDNLEVYGGAIYAHCIGQCKKCGAPHEWKKTYLFEEITNVKLIL